MARAYAPSTSCTLLTGRLHMQPRAAGCGHNRHKRRIACNSISDQLSYRSCLHLTLHSLYTCVVQHAPRMCLQWRAPHICVHAADTTLPTANTSNVPHPSLHGTKQTPLTTPGRGGGGGGGFPTDLACGCHQKRLKAHQWVVGALLHVAAVNNIHNALHSITQYVYAVSANTAL
jgi:hypothetical protein